nr:TPA_asm: hypothetical protein [Rhodactis coral adintovirus]
MDWLYFSLVRSSAKCCVPCIGDEVKHVIISFEQWPLLLKRLEPMNWGRLMTFYGYMCYSHAPWRIQYTFHCKLLALYPSHYPSSWWMLGQLIKGVWTNVLVISYQTMGGITSRLCASSTPSMSLRGLCQRMRCLVACCGSQVHIDYKDATEEEENEEPKQEEENPEPPVRNIVL